MSFISIAHQTGAWQKFKLVNEMIQPLLEPVIGNFEALYSSFVLEKNLRMVAEFDSFVRLLEITGVKDLGPFEQAVSNQAKFVGMIGGLKNEAGIQNEVLPNYLF